MPTVRLRNVAPIGDLDVDVIGRRGDQCIKAGEEFDCPVEIAGTVPGIWRAPTDAERAEAYRGVVTREVGDAPNVRTEVLCPGSGLLGSRNFELAVPAAKATGKSPTPAPEA